MDELINQLRGNIMAKMSAIHQSQGGSGDIAAMYTDFLPPELAAVAAAGMKRQAELNSELVPWLKEQCIKYSDPTTRGVIFVFVRQFIYSILKEEGDMYDVQVYRDLLQQGESMSLKMTLQQVKDRLKK